MDTIASTKIFAGTSNPKLFKAISNILRIPLGKIDVQTFRDGEIRVEIDEPIRGDTVFLLQSTCNPVNDNLMELLIMADAVRRSHAHRIIAVLPYSGYSRQDRRPGFSRTPITARLVADMIQTAGIEYVITVDVHSLQQQGFFNIPFTNISASVEIVADIWKYQSNDSIIISPDVGGVARARSIAKQLDKDLAIIDKRRSEAGKATIMNIIGNVKDKECIMVDDMVDSAGTLCKGAHALMEAGAKKIVAYATHGVFSDPAQRNIAMSVLEEVVVMDTIPPPFKDPKIRYLSNASSIAETMRRIMTNKSVSAIYHE
jgi:ribose-phosphate pyrophosphokinase